MTEQKTQTKIIKYLESIGAYVVKNISTSRNGVPDIIACYKGQFIAIEVKAKNGKSSKLQKYNIEKIKQAGGVAFVARSVEDVKERIEI